MDGEVDERSDQELAWDSQLAEHGRVEFGTRRGKHWRLFAVSLLFFVVGMPMLIDRRSAAALGVIALGLGGSVVFGLALRHPRPLTATADELRVQLAWGAERTYARSAIGYAAPLGTADQLVVYVSTDWLRLHRPPTGALAARQLDHRDLVLRNLPRNLEHPIELADWITDWALADPANPFRDKS